LEHATPITVFKEETSCIDPIHRFWYYVHVFENGELDKAFSNFPVWELQFLVDSDATNDELQWGRAYLKAYRPNQILSNSDQWRYLWSVRTNVGYRQLEHPTVNCSINKTWQQGRSNPKMYEIFFDTFLPCVIKKVVFDRQVSVATNDRTLCTVSDEAFALLLLENSFDRWQDIF
jgi:hypothetical protein